MRKFITLNSIDLNASVDASEVGAALTELGIFTPAKIVEAAKHDLRLHKYFEWDDSKAAHAYRLTQARHLVLAIGLDGQEPIRAFESVVIDDRRVYAPITQIAQTQALVDQVLQSALNELRYWSAKHQRYKDFFGGVFGAIDDAEKRIGEKYGKKEKGRKSRKQKGGNKTANSADKKAHRKHNDRRRQPAAD